MSWNDKVYRKQSVDKVKCKLVKEQMAKWEIYTGITKLAYTEESVMYRKRSKKCHERNALSRNV